MNVIRIGLVGVSFNSSNYGCAALGYGFIENLDAALLAIHQKAELTVFDNFDIDSYFLVQKPKNVIIKTDTLQGNRKQSDRKKQIQQFNQFDCVFDFTAGDSFSDIYGIRRFMSGSLVKLNLIKSTSCFILGNQTYGPYKHIMSKKLAKYIIKNADIAFSRDSISEEFVKKTFGMELKSGIDVAFALPYSHSQEEVNGKIRIGINVSGLLWSGGYNRNNQFDLKCDYKEYIHQLIKYLLKEDNYELFLIPHVISDDLNYPDNDMIACSDIIKEYGDKVKVILTKNPIEAKGIISSMTIFTGARMHAAIAAFSSGVVTIPFAYSRKFEGLFRDLNYSYVIDGMNLNTTDALNTTLNLISHADELGIIMKKSSEIIDKKLTCYQEDLADIIKKVRGNSDEKE